jgi:hypothetical protein
MRRLLELGGIAAGVILIGFGIATLALGIDARSTVKSNLDQEKIVGTPDMTEEGAAKGAKEANLPADVDLPTCDVAGEAIDSGSRARCFAQYMRVHALEATNGKVFSEMGRYKAKSAEGDDGLGGTDDEAKAAIDPESGRPVDNPRRQVWITQTALGTALNVSYMAERLSFFSIVIGIALLLTGIGFLVVSLAGTLRPAAGGGTEPALAGAD